MKRVWLLVWVSLWAWLVRAQSVVCDTGDVPHAPFTLVAPNVQVDGVSLGSVFTVGAVSPAQPLVLLAFDDAATLCVSVIGQMLTLEQDGVPVAYNTVITSALNPSDNRLQVGTKGAAGAALVIVVENPAFETAHEYTLEVTAPMRASGVPLTFAAYALDDERPPTLDILDERGRVATLDGQPLRCAAGEGTCTSLVGSAVYTVQNAVTGRPTDPAITLDLDTWPLDSVRFRVSATPHLLLIRVANDALPTSGAQLTAQGLLCDGVFAWTQGVSLRFPQAESLTLTALGDGFSDPVLAVDGDLLRCNLNSPAALFYSVDLPDAFVPVQDTSAQIALTGGDTAAVALRDDASGVLYLIVEGLVVSAEGQLIEITPTAAMANAGDALTIWVAAADDTLDPAVAWVTEEGLPVLDGFLEPYACDNAGVPEACYGLSSSLRSARLTLGEGRQLLFTSEDAVLTIPVFPQAAEGTLRLQLTSANGAAGPVVVVMKLVIGTPF